MTLKPRSLGPSLLTQLYWDGIAPLEQRFERVAEFREHLKAQPCYERHVWNQGDQRPLTWEEARDREVLSYRMESVITAPGWLDFALQYTPIAAEYLGVEVPLLYSVNAFWTRPGKAAPDPNIQEWHRDRDDRKFLVLFLYGTDVFSQTGGLHYFGLGTHRNNDGQHREPRKGEVMVSQIGYAGTCFLADTSGLHMGTKPTRGERLLAWARWGVSDPPTAYSWDGTQPVARSRIPLSRDDSAVRAVTRLVVDWNV